MCTTVILMLVIVPLWLHYMLEFSKLKHYHDVHSPRARQRSHDQHEDDYFEWEEEDDDEYDY